MMRDILFIPVGGLGTSQLAAIVSAVTALAAEVKAAGGGGEIVVLNWQGDREQYRDDRRRIWSLDQGIRKYPFHAVFTCGHSVGASTARNTANVALASGFEVAGVAILDNVEYDAGPHVLNCRPELALVRRAENSFPFYVSEIVQPKIEGGAVIEAQVVKGTGHNSLPQDAGVIADVVAAVRAARGAA